MIFRCWCPTCVKDANDKNVNILVKRRYKNI